MNLTINIKVKGLSTDEALAQLRQDSYNELPQEKNKHFWQIAKNVIREPMLALLLACGLIYLLLGDTSQALVLLFFVFVIIFITIYQENKTEKALAALKSFSSPKALVLRDNEYKKIPGREIVRNDVVFVNEGDRIPADAVLIWNNNLSVNESLLTGESLPIIKKSGSADLTMSDPTINRECLVYSGTTVISGQGLVVIKKTGPHTEIGKIGRMISEIKEEPSKIQRDFAVLIKNISVIAAIFCLFVALATYLISHIFLSSFLTGITLAMSLLPEELPVILAVFFSIGAWRMSRQQVLIKKMSMVESLGAATVLCVDKTGTITRNKMKLDKVFLAGNFDAGSPGEIIDISLRNNEPLRQLIKISALACRQNTFDPLEKAVNELKRELFPHINIYQKLNLVHEFPLSSSSLAQANVWESETGHFVAVKGAPEEIVKLCRLNEVNSQAIFKIVENMASIGLRVLAVANFSSPEKVLFANLSDYKFEFIGLLGFLDPIRDSVANSISECYQAGIKVKMITGDYPATAIHIAEKIGLENYQNIILGSDFSKYSEVELAEKIRQTSVFARMVPENKLQIIQFLKKDQQIVVMTGDGVNDGPALKAANIGVAMGEHGTDVAREAAGIVLLDDNFSSLVKGVKSGRKIFDNLKRAMVYTLATHIPIAGLVLVPILLVWPYLLFPVHIMFLELIIDPVCSVVFEAEAGDKDIMKRKPRDSHQVILNRKNLFFGFIQGLSVLITVLLVYKYNLALNLKEEIIRTLSFSTLVFANISLILVNRSWTENSLKTLFNKNRSLWPIIITVILVLILVIYNPVLQKAFGFSGLSFVQLTFSVIIGIFSMIIFEAFKFFARDRML